MELQNEYEKLKKSYLKPKVFYPIFKIQIEYDISTRKLKFNPSKEDFTKFIKDLITEAHMKIAKVGLLCTDSRFNEYLKVNDNDE